MFPALRKLYGDDPERLAQELKDNCEFYNTNPNMLPFITSIHLAMADSGMKYDETRGIKMALMGPLAGIGDSLSQFCLAPLFLHNFCFNGYGRHWCSSNTVPSCNESCTAYH